MTECHRCNAELSSFCSRWLEVSCPVPTPWHSFHQMTRPHEWNEPPSSFNWMNSTGFHRWRLPSATHVVANVQSEPISHDDLRCLSINPMTFVDDDVTVRKRFHRCKVHKYRSSWGVATLGLPAGISDVFPVCLQRCITFGILIKAWVHPIPIIPMTRWRRTGVSHSSSVFVIVDMWQAICRLNLFYTLIARTSAVVHEARACHVFVYSPQKTGCNFRPTLL